MPNRDIIVIGASAGGVEAFQKILRKVPADLQASVFIVMHLAERSKSVLPSFLSRSDPFRRGTPTMAKASEGAKSTSRRLIIILSSRGITSICRPDRRNNTTGHASM